MCNRLAGYEPLPFKGQYFPVAIQSIALLIASIAELTKFPQLSKVVSYLPGKILSVKSTGIGVIISGKQSWLRSE